MQVPAISNAVGDWRPILARLGRALVGALFLVSGLMKVGRFASVAGVLAAKGVPFPGVMLGCAVALEVGCGLALIAGRGSRLAAGLLAAFVVAATMLFHVFWEADSAAFQNQLNHFLKNVAIFGALLSLACTRDDARSHPA